jgi:hypothetical protein
VNAEAFPYTPELALDLWYLALGKEFGIIVPVADPKDTVQIMNKLYEARKDVGDPQLGALAIHMPENGESLYIYKQEVALDD